MKRRVPWALINQAHTLPIAREWGLLHPFMGHRQTKSWATESQASLATSKSIQSSPQRFGEVKRLNDKEFQEKKAKGLCFNCDDKWVVSHRCKRKELSVILLNEEDDEEFEFGGSESQASPTEEMRYLLT